MDDNSNERRLFEQAAAVVRAHKETTPRSTAVLDVREVGMFAAYADDEAVKREAYELVVWAGKNSPIEAVRLAATGATAWWLNTSPLLTLEDLLAMKASGLPGTPATH